MYRPRAEYRHKPYKTNSRSGTGVFFALLQLYIAIFTFIGVTRWVLLQPELQFHHIIIHGNRAASIDSVAHAVKAPFSKSFLFFWNKDNLLLYPRRQVAGNILRADSRIASVVVALSRSTITVDINEYTPAFRYCLPRLVRADGGTLGLPSAAFKDTDFATMTVPVLASTTEHSITASSSLMLEQGAMLSDGLMELPSPEVIGVDTHDCYWADQRGYLYARAPQYSGSPMLTITESDPSKNATLEGVSPVGTFIFNEDDLRHLSQVIDSLHASDFTVRRIVRMDSGDVVLDIGFPWNLILNIRQDPKTAVEHFLLALEQLGPVATGEKSQLKTIDVRFGNKVFYR